MERQRSAKEKVWIDRLLTWRHCRRGIALWIGGAADPEDIRDIDSPQGTYAWLREEPPDWSVYIDQTLEVLGQLSNLCRQANCEFVLADVPCPWQVSAEASDGPEVRARAGVEPHALYKSMVPFETLGAFAAKERIPFCSAVAFFRRAEQPERLFYRNAARFSPTGHELYARIVGTFLIRNIVGPWQAGRSPSGSPPNPFSTGASVQNRSRVRRAVSTQGGSRSTAETVRRTAGRGG